MNIFHALSAQILRVSLTVFLVLPVHGCGLYVHAHDTAFQGSADLEQPGIHTATLKKGQRIKSDSILRMTSDNGTVVSSIDAANTIYLSIRSSVQAYLHCYYRSSNKLVYRLYPRKKSHRALFLAGDTMILSVSSKLGDKTQSGKDTPSFLCLASAEDVDSKLPPFLMASGEAGIPEISFDNIFEIYRRATNENLIGRSLLHFAALQ